MQFRAFAIFAAVVIAVTAMPADVIDRDVEDITIIPEAEVDGDVETSAVKGACKTAGNFCQVGGGRRFTCDPHHPCKRNGNRCIVVHPHRLARCT
ncbi:hypothetical protein CC86DRAFT_373437 [Ophiobolus disseminans]|uniref:Antifungal protein n=1 Tax=Ophiobolus disseminans TaxID=1469910 RepID=A0A6A6ZPX4_9PLEO|nr:hypothetical protein CC86DRAFT_373437 [Ophiobolus disseminans]